MNKIFKILFMAISLLFLGTMSAAWAGVLHGMEKVMAGEGQAAVRSKEISEDEERQELESDERTPPTREKTLELEIRTSEIRHSENKKSREEIERDVKNLNNQRRHLFETQEESYQRNGRKSPPPPVALIAQVHFVNPDESDSQKNPFIQDHPKAEAVTILKSVHYPNGAEYEIEIYFRNRGTKDKPMAYAQAVNEEIRHAEQVSKNPSERLRRAAEESERLEAVLKWENDNDTELIQFLKRFLSRKEIEALHRNHAPLLASIDIENLGRVVAILGYNLEIEEISEIMRNHLDDLLLIQSEPLSKAIIILGNHLEEEDVGRILKKYWKEITTEEGLRSLPGQISQMLARVNRRGERERATEQTEVLRSRSDRGQIDLRLLGIPSREALVENGSSLAKILFAEEMKELWFSVTDWDSERIVAYNQSLIENPVEMLLSLEGFVLTEKAAQKALGFQNGQALDIRFLEKWPTVHKFAMALKRHLPMAVAMGVMESLRKISERKDLLEGLEKADLIEQELFYVEVNHAILQSVMLYANASCDVLSDPETYKIISRRVGQFVAAGNVVYYGKKVAQLGRLYCQGAKVRTAVEAGSMTLPGFAVATLDLAATMVVEEYLNGMVDRFIRWWEEWGYTDNIRQAQDHILHFKKDPQIDDPLPAIQNLKYRIQEYEDYLMKDVKLALLRGEMGAKEMEDYYDKRIEDIKNRRPHRKYGEYVAMAMGRSIPRSAEIEESYEKTKTGWRIRRAPVVDGKPSEGAAGYWGAVASPAQFQEMTDEEFGRYTEELIQRAERVKTETGCAIREAARKNALAITDKVYEVISPVIREQIEFLEAQFPN